MSASSKDEYLCNGVITYQFHGYGGTTPYKYSFDLDTPLAV